MTEPGFPSETRSRISKVLSHIYGKWVKWVKSLKSIYLFPIKESTRYDRATPLNKRWDSWLLSFPNLENREATWNRVRSIPNWWDRESCQTRSGEWHGVRGTEERKEKTRLQTTDEKWLIVIYGKNVLSFFFFQQMVMFRRLYKEIRKEFG